MKRSIILILSVCCFLVACEQEPTEAELRANMPTIYSMAIDLTDLTPPTDSTLNPNERRMFNEFGLPVDSSTSEGGRKFLAHPEFYKPFIDGEEKPKVYAVSNGVVRDIYPLGDNDDLIMVTPDDAELWTIGYEHVSNVQVSEGDRVAFGDYIADFSPQPNPHWPEASKTSLMIFHDNGQADEPNFTMCPFDMIHADYKQAIVDALQAHMDEWETHHSEDIFDQDAWFSFGCYHETADG